jgi:hypothetical protein
LKKILVCILVLLAVAHSLETRSANSPAFEDRGSGQVFYGLPANSTFSWPLYRQEAGLLIYKEEGGLKNFLFIVDTNQNKVTVQNVFAEMDEHWSRAGNPVCVFNAGFFEHGGAPSFPLIVKGNILPGAVTGDFPAKILYISGNTMYVENVGSNAEVQSAEWAISGLDTSHYKGDATVTNRTLVGIKQNLLYIFITQSYTIDELTGIFTNPYTIGIEPKNIIALDSGYSSQVRCFNEDFLSSPSIMGSTLIVSK